MKKIEIFGKSVPSFLVALALVGTLATAGVLTTFVSMDGEVNAKQSVVFGDDSVTQSYDQEVVGGEMVMNTFELKNRAPVDVDVVFDTTYSPDGEGITTTYHMLETLEETITRERIWGDGMFDLEGQLDVSVDYQDGYGIFTAIGPSDYDYTQDKLTFVYDTNNNGEADFQIQYNAEDMGEWKYKEVVSSSWETEWSEVPSDYITEKNGDEFTLKVPFQTIMENGYKFGVDANGQPSGNGQTYLSSDTEEPISLWHNGEDYVSSDNYVEMGITPPFTEKTMPSEETHKLGIVNQFDTAIEPQTYTISTEVQPQSE